LRVVRLGRSRDTGTEYAGDTCGVYSGGGSERPLLQLGNVDVIKQGTSALKAAAQTVETQAQALNQTASAQFKPQVVRSSRRSTT